MTTILLDCLNNFVRVEADPSSYTITCVFLTQLKKSCNVTYGLCQHNNITRNVGTSAPTDSDTSTITVQLDVEGLDLNQILCYVVKVSGGDVTIEVEGRFGKYCIIYVTS